MFDRDKWQEIIHTLKSNKFRTFLTAFGIFWGILMLLLLVGSGKGVENAAMHNFSTFATNSIFIWPSSTTVPYKGFPRGRYWSFEIDDLEALKNYVPEIKRIAPNVHGGGFRSNNRVVYKKRSGSFQIDGVYPERMKIDAVKMTHGRWINPIDVENDRKVAVIGSRVVEELFEPGEDPIGKYIDIRGVFCQVVGVFTSLHSGGWARHENQYIFMPLTTVLRIYNYGNRISSFSIVAKDHVPVSSIVEECQMILARRHSVSPDDKQAFGLHNREREYKKMVGLFSGIRALVWIVGIGTLLAGVIGVSNIMLIIVKERTKEIGIQRAMGATPLKVINQILTESIFLTTVAGSIGLILGTLIVEGVNFAMVKSGAEAEMFRNPEVDLKIAVLSLFIMVFMGALAGFLPAKRAVSIKPIDAIRSEI